MHIWSYLFLPPLMQQERSRRAKKLDCPQERSAGTGKTHSKALKTCHENTQNTHSYDKPNMWPYSKWYDVSQESTQATQTLHASVLKSIRWTGNLVERISVACVIDTRKSVSVGKKLCFLDTDTFNVSLIHYIVIYVSYIRCCSKAFVAKGNKKHIRNSGHGQSVPMGSHLVFASFQKSTGSMNLIASIWGRERPCIIRHSSG